MFFKSSQLPSICHFRVMIYIKWNVASLVPGSYSPVSKLCVTSAHVAWSKMRKGLLRLSPVSVLIFLRIWERPYFLLWYTFSQEPLPIGSFGVKGSGAWRQPLVLWQGISVSTALPLGLDSCSLLQCVLSFHSFRQHCCFV